MQNLNWGGNYPEEIEEQLRLYQARRVKAIYQCLDSSCSKKVPSLGDYCDYHEAENERRLEREKKEKERRLEVERRERVERERRFELENQKRRQEAQLQRERELRLEQEQRREQQLRKERELRLERERKEEQIKAKEKEVPRQLKQLKLVELKKEHSLDYWKRENKITDRELRKLRELGLSKDCTLNQLKEILEEDAYVNESPIIVNNEYSNNFPGVVQNNLSKSLKRVRPKLSLALATILGFPSEPSIEITPFSTWFNANCATVITKLNWTNLFDVWVAVRENPVRKMEGFINIIWVSDHLNRNEARGNAEIVRRETNGDNPALYIAPSLQVFYNNNDYLFVNIVKTSLPVTDKPDEYLLPLDIVERGSGSYRHAAIYLGDKKVCHIFADGPNSSGYSSTGSSATSGTTVSGSSAGSGTLSSASASEKAKAKARIDKWSTFLNNNPKELVRYRISIPFKKYEKEIEQIAKAVVTEYGKGIIT